MSSHPRALCACLACVPCVCAVQSSMPAAAPYGGVRAGWRRNVAPGRCERRAWWAGRRMRSCTACSSCTCCRPTTTPLSVWQHAHWPLAIDNPFTFTTLSFTATRLMHATAASSSRSTPAEAYHACRVTVRTQVDMRSMPGWHCSSAAASTVRRAVRTCPRAVRGAGGSNARSSTPHRAQHTASTYNGVWEISALGQRAVAVVAACVSRHWGSPSLRPADLWGTPQPGSRPPPRRPRTSVTRRLGCEACACATRVRTGCLVASLPLSRRPEQDSP